MSQLNAIYQTHPAPWRYTTRGNQAFMLDAREAVVPLFTMMEAAVFASVEHQKKASAAAVEPAASTL